MGQAQNDAVATGAVTAGAEPTDEQIVERVRAGDTAAFELLMRRHNQRLYRTVRSILRDDVIPCAYANHHTFNNSCGG